MQVYTHEYSRQATDYDHQSRFSHFLMGLLDTVYNYSRILVKD